MSHIFKYTHFFLISRLENFSILWYNKSRKEQKFTFPSHFHDGFFIALHRSVHKQNKTVPYSFKPSGFFGNSCYGIFDVKDYVL